MPRTTWYRVKARVTVEFRKEDEFFIRVHLFESEKQHPIEWYRRIESGLPEKHRDLNFMSEFLKGAMKENEESQENLLLNLENLWEAFIDLLDCSHFEEEIRKLLRRIEYDLYIPVEFTWITVFYHSPIGKRKIFSAANL